MENPTVCINWYQTPHLFMKSSVLGQEEIQVSGFCIVQQQVLFFFPHCQWHSNNYWLIPDPLSIRLRQWKTEESANGNIRSWATGNPGLVLFLFWYWSLENPDVLVDTKIRIDWWHVQILTNGNPKALYQLIPDPVSANSIISSWSQAHQGSSFWWDFISIGQWETLMYRFRSWVKSKLLSVLF